MTESKPNWIETPSHLGGGFAALTAPSSFVSIMPAGPEWTARLQTPRGGHMSLIITDFKDTQDVMDKSWQWAMGKLSENPS